MEEYLDVFQNQSGAAQNVVHKRSHLNLPAANQ
jgi:hypothetical protein